VLKDAREADKVFEKYRDDKKHGKKAQATGGVARPAGAPRHDSFDTTSMPTTGAPSRCRT
jgi:hypothetical protein